MLWARRLIITQMDLFRFTDHNRSQDHINRFTILTKCFRLLRSHESSHCLVSLKDGLTPYHKRRRRRRGRLPFLSWEWEPGAILSRVIGLYIRHRCLPYSLAGPLSGHEHCTCWIDFPRLVVSGRERGNEKLRLLENDEIIAMYYSQHDQTLRNVIWLAS